MTESDVPVCYQDSGERKRAGISFGAKRAVSRRSEMGIRAPRI